MKNPEQNPSERGCRPGGIISPGLVIGLWSLLIAGLAGEPIQAQPVPPPPPGSQSMAGGDMQDQQVLTRGPVHEAFAGIISYNPEPGIVVPKAPPEAIEEVPPDQRPEGDNVTWIPGYWTWDDERNDFIWISGVWRALPPGREWVPGYWGQTSNGYQWTSGFWADANANDETTYLPPPPATVETGPNIAAPAEDYVWTPGCWVWVEGRYAWRPGYWVEVHPDWIWIPACYVYTPHGCVFVDGYWDYPVQRRGVIFAPVYFQAEYYARPHHYYSPSIVISLDIFSDALFCSPRRQHYYFGDYYDTRYEGAGFYASFSFESRRRGCDPIFTHERWEHRSDRDWERHVETTYRERRENVNDRPARTWADARRDERDNHNNDAGRNRRQLASPYEQVVRERSGPVRFQAVAQTERQTFVQREHDVQKNRDERRTLETRIVNKTTINNNIQNNNIQVSEPSRLKIPRSAIVARQANQNSRDQAPPRPNRAGQSDSNHNAVDRQNQQNQRRDASPRPDAGQPDVRQRNVPDRNDRSTPNDDRNPSHPDRAAAPDRTAVPTRTPVVPDRTVQPDANHNAVDRQNQRDQQRRDASPRPDAVQPDLRQRNVQDRNDRLTPSERSAPGPNNNDRNPARPDRATVPDRTADPTRTPVVPDRRIAPDQTATPNRTFNNPDRTAVPDRTITPDSRPTAVPERREKVVPREQPTPQVRPDNQPDRTPHDNTDNRDKNVRQQTDSPVAPVIQPERQRETAVPPQRDANARQNIVREPSSVPVREPKANNDTPRAVESQSPARNAPVIREKEAPAQPVKVDANNGSNKPDGADRRQKDKQQPE